ncbi:hypothetical protein C8Q72DRAFT_172845 [Fomitopsis betulina]|nr:hypothetical protein C8Q72DRAFT_172845 [Fomitopsis betulina]
MVCLTTVSLVSLRVGLSVLRSNTLDAVHPMSSWGPFSLLSNIPTGKLFYDPADCGSYCIAQFLCTTSGSTLASSWVSIAGSTSKQSMRTY